MSEEKEQPWQTGSPPPNCEIEVEHCKYGVIRMVALYSNRRLVGWSSCGEPDLGSFAAEAFTKWRRLPPIVVQKTVTIQLTGADRADIERAFRHWCMIFKSQPEVLGDVAIEIVSPQPEPAGS